MYPKQDLNIDFNNRQTAYERSYEEIGLVGRETLDDFCCCYCCCFFKFLSWLLFFLVFTETAVVRCSEKKVGLKIF